MTITSIIIFFSILFFLVVIHELGHFLAAKFFSMRVDEFAFGFPPRLLRKKIGETVYSFNLIPLGGFVKIFGENGLDEEEIKNLSENDKKKLFGSKPWWQRIIVLSGGVAFNILGAVLLFACAFMYGSSIPVDKDDLANVPVENRDLVLAYIDDKSPLVGTGIVVGDKITGISANDEFLQGNDLTSYSAAEFIQKHNNSTILINFKNSEGEDTQVKAVPKAGIIEGKKVLGARFADLAYKKYSLFESLGEAVKTTYYQIKGIFVSLYTLLRNSIWGEAKVEESLSGPVGLAMMTSKVSERGVDQILIFAAMLSLSLAVFNILPIPALDGGRIVFVLLEAIRRKKVKASTEQIFHGFGFLLLLCLMVFVTYFDIVRAIAS